MGLICDTFTVTQSSANALNVLVMDPNSSGSLYVLVPTGCSFSWGMRWPEAPHGRSSVIELLQPENLLSRRCCCSLCVE